MTSTAEALTQRLAATPIVGLIGLGYVGLPLAVAFAESGATVIGLDVDPTRVARVRAGESFVEDVPTSTDRKSTRLNSSHGYISYAVFCLKKKNKYLQYTSQPP